MTSEWTERRTGRANGRPLGPPSSPLRPTALGVDWQRPWLSPWRWGSQVEAHLAQATTDTDDGTGPAAVAQALNAQPACPVRFVSQARLPAGEAYETFIRRTGQVPTRDNLHDFFNGLVWLGFPLSKSRLNQLQAAEIARQGVGAVRGPVRDAITVFDENGALLLAPEPLWQALLCRDWQGLFITHRGLWAQARLVVFGHALMEQLVTPRKNITAHVLMDTFAPDLQAWGPMDGWPDEGGCPPGLDAALAARLDANLLARKPFTPLPVLGVPGWWPDNHCPHFYADASVFRPARCTPERTPR